MVSTAQVGAVTDARTAGRRDCRGMKFALALPMILAIAVPAQASSGHRLRVDPSRSRRRCPRHVRLVNGKTITVVHNHRMMDMPCLDLGEHVIVTPDTPRAPLV